MIDINTKLKNLSFFALASIIIGNPTAQAQYSSSNQLAAAKFRAQQSDYLSQSAANKLICPTSDMILRVNVAQEGDARYQCSPAGVGGLYPECKNPFDPRVQVCVYKPRPVIAPIDPSAKVTPEVAIANAVEQVNQFLQEPLSDAEVFINVNAREKSLGKFLKKAFETSGRVQANSPTTTVPNPLPTGGLLAFNTPESAAAAKTSADDKVIPLALKGNLKFISLSTLNFIRDHFLAQRFEDKLSMNAAELGTQKLQFLNEIISRLQVTGYIDDTYTSVADQKASSLGCKSYGITQLKIMDPRIINLNDGEIAVGHGSKNENDKKAASILSYWYKTAGLAPYVTPAQPAIFDEEVVHYIKTRFLTCEKLPGMSELPVLAKVAPHFLSEVTKALVHTTTRDMHAWHWTSINYLAAPEKSNITPNPTDDRVKWYLEANWRKFYFQPTQGDNVGNGLYLSLTPSTTRHIGNTAIDLAIPKGTRFISLIQWNLTLSTEARDELTKLNCGYNNGYGITSFFTGPVDCLNIARALVRQLKISMSAYSYTPSSIVNACTDASVPGWSLVVYDPELVTPSHVTVYNTQDQSPSSKFNTEQKMIAEYIKQARNIYSSNSPVSMNSGISPDEFSKWVNSEILGCGMGRDWTSAWQ